tara:strand:+ start:57 stop:167 length:111 start_codon:yes stop_codon:yes gene_type:complete
MELKEIEVMTAEEAGEKYPRQLSFMLILTEWHWLSL